MCRCFLLALGTALAMNGGSVAAKDKAPRSSPYLDAMGICRSVPAAGERAACYDKAWDGFVAAREKNDVVIIDRESVRETRKGLFGFSGLKLPFLGGEDDADAPQEVNSTIAAVTPIGRGVYRIRLSEGAVWQTTDELTGVPRVGGVIRIRRTGMGGFALTLGRGRAARAIRVQ